jgi:hypothetical protein
MINILIGNYEYLIFVFVLSYETNFHRSKYFKGKKIFADYDIRVEQVFSISKCCLCVSICCVIETTNFVSMTKIIIYS